jgi:uncharacterized protein HemX
MTFKSPIWFPIAVGLSVINLVWAGFAAGSAEPAHATVHAALAVAFGLWARRQLQVPEKTERQASLESPDAIEALGALESEVNQLRQQLSETQERLDFAERILAQRPEPRKVDPQR